MTSLGASPNGGDHNSGELDVATERLVLPKHLVPVALLLMERTRLPRDDDLASEMDALATAEVTVDGALHPLVRRILSPVAAPTVVVSIRIGGAGGKIATVWASRAGATIGESQDPAAFALAPVERHLVPFHLAGMTGTGIRPLWEGPAIRLGTARYRAVRTAAAVDANVGRVMLKAAGAADPESAVMAELLSPGAMRWCISVISSGADGFVGDRRLEVIDGDEHGYWEVTRLPADRAIVFTPRSIDMVLRMLGDIVLPG